MKQSSKQKRNSCYKKKFSTWAKKHGIMKLFIKTFNGQIIEINNDNVVLKTLRSSGRQHGFKPKKKSTEIQ
jgi:uncharacterized protein YjaZ